MVYLISLLAAGLVIFMIIKKMDIKITLLFCGVLLMYIGIFAMGNTVAISEYETIGGLLDPFNAIILTFKDILVSSGFVILILCGYSAYMDAIGANKATVDVLTTPLKKIKSAYILVPFVFLLGNFLSLVVPSASTLAIILLATLYPVLRKSGMSALTAGGVIATTATIMPTPLGADNVAIATELAKYPEYANMTPSLYVFGYHALVSIPTIILIAVVHYFWQKRCDKKANYKFNEADIDELDLDTENELTYSGAQKYIYSLFPLLPIILLLGLYVIGIDMSVEIITLLSFTIVLVIGLLFERDIKATLSTSENFFSGMGRGMPVVALLVAATVFVTGLKTIGLIDAMQTAMQTTNAAGFVLPLFLTLATVAIVLMSGSGTALFFAMVPLMYPLAQAAGIDVFAISIPLGLAGNLMRAVSPVSAVVVIVAGTINENPLNIVKRTSVPMVTGLVFMFVLSMIMFL